MISPTSIINLRYLSNKPTDSYKDFPPIKNFKFLLVNCPQCAALYIELWKNMPRNPRFTIRKSDIKKKFMISVTLFKNQLISMARFGIINLKMKDDLYTIELLHTDESAS